MKRQRNMRTRVSSPGRSGTNFSLVGFLFVAVLSSSNRMAFAQQSENPLHLNGGSILAMAGRDSVAVAVDRRFGRGASLVNIGSSGNSQTDDEEAPPQILMVPSAKEEGSLTLVATSGLRSDVQSFHRELGRQLLLLKQSRQGKPLSPAAVASLTSHLLFQRRSSSPYYVEPIVAGIGSPSSAKVLGSGEKDNPPLQPFICAMDMIGARSSSSSFAGTGAAHKSLYGTAEALWRPDLTDDELVQCCGAAFRNALERDCYSGYGAAVYLLKSDGSVVEHTLATRTD